MSDLDELLGIDPNDPAVHLATELAKEDHYFKRALIWARMERGFSRADVSAALGWAPDLVAEFEAYDSDMKLSDVRRYALVVGAMVEHRVLMPSSPSACGADAP